jgi:hypothetical protein
VALAIVAVATAITLTGGCSSSPTAKEDFRKDLEEMGYRLKGDITSDQEKKSSLGLAMAFDLPASSKPRNNSKNGGGSNSDPKPRNTSTKKGATTGVTPSAASTKSAGETVTILEAVVTIHGCKVQVERSQSENHVSRTVGGRGIENFWVDEVNRQDAEDAPTGAPTVSTVRAYLAFGDFPCFTG